MVSHTAISKRFYRRTIRRIENELTVPDDLCFVYVQHAFLPVLTHYESVDKRLAGLVLKDSSSKQNPFVVKQIKRSYPTRYDEAVSRSFLRNPRNAINFLNKVTKGRPFVILEYGGYFAPAASAICDDKKLGSQFKGVVEGTENGIRGSGDSETPGYCEIADRLACPVISKARSDIKRIMDLEIGPAIVSASDEIHSRCDGFRLKHSRGNIGIIGLGKIGYGILNELKKINLRPAVFDTNLSIMAELAHCQNNIRSQKGVLEQSDILFLCTGSCFLSMQPGLLKYLKNNCLLVLCTSGDVEGGVPQLIASGEITRLVPESNDDIAIYQTRYGTRLRIMLGNDGVGQAPNMTIEDGSLSPANMMSDMEFYALGCYLGSGQSGELKGGIYESPLTLQSMILEEWLQENYPAYSTSGRQLDAPGGSLSSEVKPQYTDSVGKQLPALQNATSSAEEII